MFGNLLKRFKGSTAGLASSALSVNDEVAMSAMVAAMVKVCYANDVCDNDEVDSVNKMISTNPQLKEFRNEPVRLFDSLCDQYEASPMQAKLDLDKTIAKVIGDVESSERVLICAIQVAYASKAEDDESPIDEKEDEALYEIAKMLDLKLGKFI